MVGHSNTEAFANSGAVPVVDRKATFRPRADGKGRRIISYKYTNWTRGIKREVLDGRDAAHTPPILVKDEVVCLTSRIPFEPSDVHIKYWFNNIGDNPQVNHNVGKASGNKGGRFTWKTVKPDPEIFKRRVCTFNADDGTIIETTCCSGDPQLFGCFTGDPPCLPEPCEPGEPQGPESEDNALMCGDGVCGGGENSCSCPEDCGAGSCGDGICCAADGEDCGNCPGDCGACVCGDGECNGSETCDTCSGDCGECPCGDCPTDVDGDGKTGASDLAFLLGNWGSLPPDADPAILCLDSDGDGTIGASDLAQLLGNWGQCPDQKTGGCCLPGDSWCYEGVTDSECLLLEGVFGGDGSLCEAELCGVPAEKKCRYTPIIAFTGGCNAARCPIKAGWNAMDPNKDCEVLNPDCPVTNTDPGSPYACAGGGTCEITGTKKDCR